VKQVDFALQWFQRQPHKKFTPAEIREFLAADFLAEHGKTFSDPNRAARTLVQAGRLQRSQKGMEQSFWYDPSLDTEPEEFTSDEKTQIFERDSFRCRICGRGPVDNTPIFVGYAKSINRGGKLDVDNGRTLCGVHRWVLETAQDSAESAVNFRRLRARLPRIGESPRATNFWNEFLELLKRYEIDPTN
jgi:hypothetical protein